MMTTFFYWKGKFDDQWYFHLKDKNHATILASTEGYQNEQGCLRGIISVQHHASNYQYYDKFMGADYKYYFKLKAANNDPIGRSEGYNTMQSRDQAIVNCSIEAQLALSKRI